MGIKEPNDFAIKRDLGGDHIVARGRHHQQRQK